MPDEKRSYKKDEGDAIDTVVRKNSNGTNNDYVGAQIRKSDTESNSFDLEEHHLAAFSGRKVNVTVEAKVSLEGIRLFAREYYRIATASSETGLSKLLSEPDFVRYIEIVAKDRVRWIRQKSGRDVRHHRRIGLTPSATPIPQPLFAAISQIGTVAVDGLNVIPILVDEEGNEIHTTQEDYEFIASDSHDFATFFSELGRFFHVNDAMPSQTPGSMAMLVSRRLIGGDDFEEMVHVRGKWISTSPSEAAAAAMLDMFRGFLKPDADLVSLGTHANAKDLRRAAILKTKRDLPRGFAF